MTLRDSGQTHLKTGDPQGSASSNLAPSAFFSRSKGREHTVDQGRQANRSERHAYGSQRLADERPALELVLRAGRPVDGIFGGDAEGDDGESAGAA